MMKKFYKIIFLIALFILIIINCSITDVYAQSEREELLELLDDYKEDLGDLTEFKQVIDKIYDDLYSSTKVDDSLKEKLNTDIDALTDVTNIDPLMATVLEIELKSQVNNLTDSNIDEMREEISILKEWADKQVASNDNNNNEENKPDIPGETNKPSETDVPNKPVDNSTTTNQNSNESLLNKLPYAGKINISLMLIVLIIISLFCIIKYRQFKEL